MELYKRIKKRREELGLSQEELAHRMGYRSRSSINKIELGLNDIPQSKISKFAEALETTEVYLLGFEENPDPSLAELSKNYMKAVYQTANKYGINLSQISNVALDKEKTDFSTRDERDIKKDLDSLMEKLKNQENGPAAYNGEALDPEAAELFREELEIALKRLKIINKEKYNPYKNKK